ncbi:Malate-2H(+)/Na(+)-lactate antiporter [Bremerella volcania]|uniref:Malate-2H(+)/Na(+)-lactate antiporter n=1 Tax=Bremerella volcania TaxID=2527984 RepID=A0A518C3Z8_9BACT|nr:Na+/H+ antiporter NhaC family protein [Bremerella volcania]QDU73947.1 Malate-2H(+)/Na(+)-lactate antiporter [Bremerella volcania]
MDPHPFGWLSLVPPLVAIALAILTRRTLLSLLFGIVVGAVILQGGNPITGLWSACADYLWVKATDWDKVQVYLFTLLTGGMIGVVSASGGMRGLVNLIVCFANTRVKGQVTGWLMGLAIFFDDYANMLLLGGTLKEVTDRLKISREKLAYIVDSTAAPVAGLALISTWVATEISFIEEGINQISGSEKPDAFLLFVESIPYRFYSWWALLLVPLVAMTRRDFGPMLKAEVAMLSQGPARNAASDDEGTLPESSSWLNAAIPVGTMLIAVIAILHWTGYQAATGEEVEPSLLQIIGQGDSYKALLYGSAISLAVAVLLIAPQRLLSVGQMGRAILKGFRAMLPALLILWLAASLAAQTEPPTFNEETGAMTLNGLDTAGYLKQLLEANLPIEMLPTTVFILAAAVAFSTGTSWGTMGILVPLSVSLSAGMLTSDGEPLDVADPVLLSVVGSVLAGAIFGDHCSPISDTTILSSQSCGCDHMAHVRTQMPYAILGAVLSVILGTVPVAYGVPVYLCHVLGVGAMAGTLFLLGKNPETLAAEIEAES